MKFTTGPFGRSPFTAVNSTPKPTARQTSIRIGEGRMEMPITPRPHCLSPRLHAPTAWVALSNTHPRRIYKRKLSVCQKSMVKQVLVMRSRVW